MSGVAKIALRPGYEITRVIRGGWQLAGGHGAIDRERAVDDLVASFDAGITTYDCADIYTGVEELIGAFRARVLKSRGEAAARAIHVHTKFVPDLAALGSLDRAYVASIIDRSLMRLGMERLDIVQFHWWNYAIPGLVEAAGWLDELRRAGKIRYLGLTNFDAPHLQALLDAGVAIVSAQVQYSALDQRPENGFSALCQKNGVSLLCYGSVAGGFLSERWLGAREPTGPLENRSLVKYKLVIDDFGGWDRFQALLAALKRVADRRGVDIASVAGAYVLAKPQVAAIIVGARNSAHAGANAHVPSLALEAADRAEIAAAIAGAPGLRGDVYALERDIGGRHGAIMHYNNNAKS